MCIRYLCEKAGVRFIGNQLQYCHISFVTAVSPVFIDGSLYEPYVNANSYWCKKTDFSRAYGFVTARDNENKVL